MGSGVLTCDVAVVGAGPAGLAAAEAAARAGADVICLDQFPQPGGQYHMQPNAPGTPFADSDQVRHGRAAAEACAAAGVRLLTGAEVFWARPADPPETGFRLHAAQRDDAVTIRARCLVAACGAMERPMPFPGWTLPGVIGAGAAQRLLKTSGNACRLPFDGKVVLAGSGPFLLAVAATFARAGQGIDHFVELQPTAPLRKATALLRHPARLREAASLLRDLARTGAKRHFGAIVTRARGDDRLRAVEIAPLDAHGRPDPGRARVVEGVGALCVGYGFQPVIDLTTALGAEHAYDPALGGWYCLSDPVTCAASRPGLYVAGEGAGIGGALPARLSGRLAGLHAAAACHDARPAGRLVRPVARDLARARAFAATLARLYPLPERFPHDLQGDEIVCRCEDVALSEIRTAIDEGARETFAVKMWTRAGMGLCQGRSCGAGIAAALAEAGVAPQQAGYNRSHFPLRPVPADLARAALRET